MFLFILLFSCLTALEPVQYVWGNSFDTASFQTTALEAFYDCYQHIPPTELGLPPSTNTRTSLAEWAEAFAEQLSTSPEPHFRLLTATQEGQVIGFALFDMTAFPTYVYLHCLAVHPSHQKQGIGKTLVYSLLQEYPDTEKLTVVCRRVNLPALAFYSALRFTDSEFVEAEHSDPAFWKSLEYLNAK